MDGYTLSTYMQLPIPQIGIDPGPDYAKNINQSLTQIDGHTHLPGKGMPITSGALSIDADINWNGNNIIGVRATRFQSQNSPIGATGLELSEIYVYNGDLFFNPGYGGPSIAITVNGGVAGTPGSIGNLTNGASVNFNSVQGTFVFQANASNLPGNIDAGTVTVRDTVPNGKGVTLQTISGLGSDYNLILPVLPSSQKILTLDALGNILAQWQPDNSTITVVSDNLTVQGQNIPNSAREHAWELNGKYGSLTFPLNNLDSIMLVPYNVVINSVWIYNGQVGTSGTTEYDLKFASSPGAAFTSILSTTGKVNYNTSLTSITRINTVATATLANHGFLNGETVTISGASQTEYNGSFVISNVTANTFQYTVSGSPATPATGSPKIVTRSLVWTDSNSVVGPQAGVTKPVVNSPNLTAGGALRWDLIQGMPNAQDARIKIFYTQT
jgi:hypothetical protein